MSVLVGYLAGKTSEAPLRLAGQFAHSLDEPLTVASIVPQPWATPSPARVDAEFSTYVDKLVEDSKNQARSLFASNQDAITIDYLRIAARDAGDGLLEAIQRCQADLLVLGASSESGQGQLSLGSTGDWLAHGSPVPVAIAPPGYDRPPSAKLSRITCAYSGTRASTKVLRRAGRLAIQLHLPLRVVSFAVRGHAMYPPEVGLRAEDALQQAWAERLQAAQAQFQSDPVLAKADFSVQTASDWRQALHSMPWQADEILLLGATSRPRIKGLFLGSRGAKIIRHSPLPVLLLPG